MELEPDFGPGFCLEAQAFCQEGEFAKAVAIMLHVCPLLAAGGFYGPGLLGYCYARGGRQEEARRLLADLEKLREHSYAQAIAWACVLLGLGEKERAIERLERAPMRNTAAGSPGRAKTRSGTACERPRASRP